MEKYCFDLYGQLERNLQKCDAFRQSTLQWIECCFQVCELCCIKLQKHKHSFQFLTKNDEVNFIKILQPKFTSLVEYYKFLYKAEVFAPVSVRDAVEYWYHELETANAFLQKHKAFHLYWKSGCKEHDKEYFLKNNNDDAFNSQLLAKLIAKEKISEYVIGKIQSLNVRSIV